MITGITANVNFLLTTLFVGGCHIIVDMILILLYNDRLLLID